MTGPTADTPNPNPAGFRRPGRRRLVAAFAVLACLFSGPVHSVEPAEMLADPAQEARARALSEEIRCLVCQNQSIDESDASLAKDMRLLVRKQIKAGKSDDAIRDFLVARYGDFVLLRPPVRTGTWLLWFGPLLVLLAGIAGLVLYFRARNRQAAAAPDALSAEEQARLDRLLQDNDPTS